QIVSVSPIDGGVEVHARAWDKNGQIGFGPDGTVDIERFLIYNPPILVPDPTGTVQRVHTNPLTGVETIGRYREDAREALMQTLEDIIRVKQQKFGSEQIIVGKVGSTTSTFYPDKNQESSSVDGEVFDNLGNPGIPWAQIEYGSGNGADDTSNINNGPT